MSIFDRRPRLRWAVPAAAGALILAGTAAGTVIASADAGLPPRTAQELLVDLQDPQTDTVSGTVVASADLGLPALPTGMGSSAELTALVSGSHTLRVWSDGPDRARLAMIGSSEETDVIRNGRDVWVWASDGDTVDHYVLPERDAAQQARRRRPAARSCRARRRRRRRSSSRPSTRAPRSRPRVLRASPAGTRTSSS